MPPESTMEESTREKIKEAAQSGIVQLVLPGIMAIATLFLGYAVNRLSDHFDRIDAHLAASDTSTVLLRHDVDTLQQLVPQRTAEIKEIRDKVDRATWKLDELTAEPARRGR